MSRFASPNSCRNSRPPARRALTLAEVVVSTLIVAVMTVAALDGLGATTRSSELAGNRGIAQGLADDLIAEILSTAYSDPGGAAVFGLEPGESTGTRANFDDVDDYNNWTEQPPQPKTWPGTFGGATSYAVGEVVTYLGSYYACIQPTTGHLPTDDDYWQLTHLIGYQRDNWRRKVTVERVVPTNPTQVTAGTDQGAKRIRVTVEYNGVVLADEYAVVTDADQ
jgi:type II secretory pathway pseudopilin PulG